MKTRINTLGIFICIMIALLISGCASIEERPVMANMPSVLKLDKDHTIYGVGKLNLKSEWVVLPAGDYIYRFTKNGIRYYMRDDPNVRLKTTIPERPYLGGISYSMNSGRFFAFGAREGTMTTWIGGGLTTLGEKGALSCFPMGLITDEDLAQIKDQDNQPLIQAPATK